MNNLYSPIVIGFSSITYGASNIGQKNMLQTQVPSKYRVSIPSFFSALGNMLFAIFSIIFGILSDKYGISMTLTITIIISALFSFTYNSTLVNDKKSWSCQLISEKSDFYSKLRPIQMISRKLNLKGSFFKNVIFLLYERMWYRNISIELL